MTAARDEHSGVSAPKDDASQTRIDLLSTMMPIALEVDQEASALFTIVNGNGSTTQNREIRSSDELVLSFDAECFAAVPCPTFVDETLPERPQRNDDEYCDEEDEEAESGL